jgi:hypothetical protein
MFEFEQAQRLEEVRWEDRPDPRIYYIEAWKYANINECTTSNCYRGTLQSDEIDPWLQQKVTILIIGCSRRACIEELLDSFIVASLGRSNLTRRPVIWRLIQRS